MNPTIKSSDAEGLERVSKGIMEYADNLKKNIKDLMYTHDNMYQYWQGPQYNDFTNVILEVNSVIVKEVEKLEGLAKHAHMLSVQLEKSQNSSLK